ncbi:hypothetical protein CANINC_001386 [Pichia inconspicua]|uniref:N-alpha-acetyltransferase 40 n=1 Tax=Pichia inconspicua TaxID=52247 RepID=A0A4T0X4X3_9ASCO|nr:hypothetical protein CANINC_001386 [[Candida] inconspicua]
MLDAKIIDQESVILLDTVKNIFQDPGEQLLKWQLEFVLVTELTSKKCKLCLDLLDANLGPTYSKVNGKDWKLNKKEEMKEPGLVYLLLWDEDKLVGFLSFKFINEYQLVLYLYEIQFTEALRGNGLGTLMIEKLEMVVKNVNSSKRLAQLWSSKFPEEFPTVEDALLVGIGLTVFSSNEGAMRLYTRLGFTIGGDSPRDYVLRNGKVIKPPYYMMEKRVVD